MKPWTESSHCASRVHCVACRTDAGFRRGLRRGYEIEGSEGDEFACPHGVTAETAAGSRFDRKGWHWLARIAAEHARVGDRGLGDTIERVLGRAGALYKRVYRMLTGRDCGCARRAEFLNQKYPYQWKPRSP